MKIGFYYKYNIAKFISNSIGICFKNTHYKCLLYHSIGSDYENDNLKIYNVSKNRFLEHMKIIKKSDFKVSSDIKQNLKENENRLSITFDDGYFSIYENALDILIDLNIPFIIFVSPELIKSNSGLYMNEEQIKRIASSELCTIGSHGYEHKDFTSYELHNLINLQNKSKKYLEDLIGKEVNLLSYPYGIFDQEIDKNLKKINFHYTFTSRFGSNQRHTRTLNRIDVWSLDNINQFTKKLQGQWDWLKYIK